MSVSAQTRSQLKKRYREGAGVSSLSKDLKKVARFVSVVGEDGLSLLYEETQPPLRFDSARRLGKTKRNISSFFHVRRVLLTLCMALEGSERCREVDTIIRKHFETAKFELGAFLPSAFPEGSPVSKVLTCFSESYLKSAPEDFRQVLGASSPTSVVEHSWRVRVLVSSENVHIVHEKREQCVINRFELKWELTTSLKGLVFDEVAFKITDLRFNFDFISEKARADIQQSLNKFIDPELFAFLSEQHLPICPSLSLAERDRDILLPGELVVGMFDNVQYLHSQLPESVKLMGRLLVTNFKILLGTPEDLEILNLPLACILRTDLREGKEVEFVCKEILSFRLGFGEAQYEPFIHLVERIFPVHPNQLFVSAYYQACVGSSDIELNTLVPESVTTNGWRVYNPLEEFERLQLESHRWRVSSANAAFELCPSYPKHLVVPNSLTDAELLSASQHRGQQRIPVLAWRHRNGSFLCHGAGLAIAQKSGEGSLLPSADSKLLEAIMRNGCSANGNQLTPRGSSSRIATPLTPKGSTKASFSKRNPFRMHAKKTSDLSALLQESDMCILEFGESTQGLSDAFEAPGTLLYTREVVNIDSLAEMQETYSRIQRLCTAPYSPETEENWLTQLEATRWISQQQNLMQTALRVVEMVTRGTSVLLCYPESEFDRVCQVSSLAQLWMDPHYRTLAGFAKLIEKEWLSFGHSFSHRAGYLTRENHPEIAPVFIQFLDGVWQSLQQFPYAFQFTNKLLVELAAEYFSARYGTFSFNNDRERRAVFAPSSTASFWTHVLLDPSYLSPLYVADWEATLLPSADSRSLALWTSYFLRWYQGDQIVSLPRTSAETCGSDILAWANNSLASSAVERFQSQLDSLKSAERDIMAKIQAEKERLKLIKGGADLPAANIRILERRQTNEMPENSPKPSSRPKRSRVRALAAEVPISPSMDNIQSALQLSQVSSISATDEAQSRTARSFTETKEEATKLSDSGRGSSRKKKPKTPSRRIAPLSGSVGQ